MAKQEVQDIIDATDIVALVSEYVQLEKQGKNYKGLCPFHHEDTPSFVVNQEKKLAHCFGCGGGGDPIKFLMQIENIEYKEALYRLAKRNGFNIKNYQESTTSNPLTKYYKIMQTAQAFYKKYLTNSDSGLEALDYLHKRGLDDETIKVFGVGLAPQNQDSLYQVLKESNYLELDMADVGLVDKNERGYYDIFSKRILFPICNEQGNYIGFSGRIFKTQDKNQPKYVNTKETLLFRKKEILFNLHLAKGEILKKKRVILHEGQMDVIASYRSGLKEAICTMGTALSIEQAQLLKKYTNHAIICYDGDKAGVNASLKAIKIFKQAGFIVHLVLLPNGMDPDEYVMQYGIETYATYFETHLMDSYAYLYEQALLNKNLNDEVVIDSVKNQVFEMLLSSKSKTIEEEYLSKLAIGLSVSYNALYEDYQRYCNLFAPSESVDIYENSKNDIDFLKPVPVIEPDWMLNFEIRLFMYAKSSKEKAIYIDKMLNDRIEAMSLDNQNLWISLINDFYASNEEFDENKFMSILSNEACMYYIKITEMLKKDKTPYTDEDLNDCLEKLKQVKYDKKNLKLSKDLSHTEKIDKQMEIVLEKFKNKKQKEKLKKMRRK